LGGVALAAALACTAGGTFWFYRKWRAAPRVMDIAAG